MKRHLLALTLFLALPLQAEKPPNIVVVLADDLGIEALAAYGGRDHKTPHIDRLVAEGMRFSHCFSNPTCSPSRATLLTGCYSFRHRVKFVIWDRVKHQNLYLRTTHPSFARQLKQAGYATAIAGKWQLSFLGDRKTIRDFGFDEYQCWQIFDEKGTKTRRFHQPHFLRNGEIVEGIDQRYGPDVNVDFLIDFIKRNAAAEKPFLAYHTCLLPHYPWVPAPDSEDQTDPLKNNAAKGDPKFYSGMVAYLDKMVGRLMAAVEEAGVADNTVFIFVADNGTDQKLSNRYGDDHTVLGGKGSMTDRGTRVPLVVRWPGKVAKGSTCDDLIDFTDFLPTLCEVGGAPLPEGIHGRSFLPQLTGKKGNPRAWVQIQDREKRHLRSRNYIFEKSGKLRPVTELWKTPAKSLNQPFDLQAADHHHAARVMGLKGEGAFAEALGFELVVFGLNPGVHQLAVDVDGDLLAFDAQGHGRPFAVLVAGRGDVAEGVDAAGLAWVFVAGVDLTFQTLTRPAALLPEGVEEEAGVGALGGLELDFGFEVFPRGLAVFSHVEEMGAFAVEDDVAFFVQFHGLGIFSALPVGEGVAGFEQALPFRGWRGEAADEEGGEGNQGFHGVG